MKAFHTTNAIQTLITLVLLSGIVQASEDDIVKTVDLTNGSNSGLYVVFCARDKVPGHAFVVLGKDDEEKKVCSVESFGLYPAERGIKAAFGTVPGKIADEALQARGTNRANCRLIVKVSKEGFQKAEKTRKKWSDKGEYKLIEKDCVSFAGDVAESLGLKIPERSKAKLPQTFIRSMAEIND